MSNKPFNASSVSKTLFGKNNLEVTFVDHSGAKQIVNLSPQARNQMMLALLARPSLQELDKLQRQLGPEHLLNVQGITSFVLGQDKPALEIILAQGMSVYLTFPPDGIKKFQVVLSDLERALMTPTTH
jgi:hypothetical protein